MSVRTVALLFILQSLVPTTLSSKTLQDDDSAPSGDNTPQAWFVDGYHGGIYGHYPVEWYTRFMADRLDANPSWNICMEIEPETWDTVALRTPAEIERLRALVAAGRIEFTNPTYAQPYLYNISGESIIRQFATGIRKLQTHFPGVAMGTYAAEEPCFTSCLPQLLCGLGFRYVSLKCPDTCWGGYMAEYGGETVRWVGPDGTSLMTVPRYACEDLKEGSVWQTMAWDNSPAYIRRCTDAGITHPVGMCFQDAGWKNGPWLGRHADRTYPSTYTTWTDYIENIADTADAPAYRVSQDDVRVALVWGSQVMQRVALAVRNTENTLVRTEKIAAMAAMAAGCTPPQDDMAEAWRQLMLAQHHDAWITPYNRVRGGATWADTCLRWTASADSIAAAIVDAAVASMLPDGDSHMCVINTTAHRRCEPVIANIPGGDEVCFMADVPPFGYVSYSRDSITNPAAEDGVRILGDSCVMENDLYRITFDLARGGAISSLVSKNDGCNYVTSHSTTAFNALRGYFPGKGGFRSSTEHRATAEVATDNGLLTSVRIRGTVASVPFISTVTIKHGSPVIDCEIEIEWHRNVSVGAVWRRAKNDKTVAFYDTRYMLNVSFPSVAEGGTLYKDAPFDVCRSTLTDTYFNRWDSIKNNVALHWIDLCGSEGRSLALFTDRTTSYSIGEATSLALTVQYSGPGLWNRNHVVDGSTRLRYALVPHTGAWDTADIQALSERWNEPLTAYCCGGEDASMSMVTVDDGYEISSLTAEDGTLTLRLYNASGDDSPHKITLSSAIATVEETDLRGNTIASVAAADSTAFYVSMPRFGVRTYRLTIKTERGDETD